MTAVFALENIQYADTPTGSPATFDGYKRLPAVSIQVVDGGSGSSNKADAATITASQEQVPFDSIPEEFIVEYNGVLYGSFRTTSKTNLRKQGLVRWTGSVFAHASYSESGALFPNIDTLKDVITRAVGNREPYSTILASEGANYWVSKLFQGLVKSLTYADVLKNVPQSLGLAVRPVSNLVQEVTGTGVVRSTNFNIRFEALYPSSRAGQNRTDYRVVNYVNNNPVFPSATVRSESTVSLNPIEEPEINLDDTHNDVGDYRQRVIKIGARNPLTPTVITIYSDPIGISDPFEIVLPFTERAIGAENAVLIRRWRLQNESLRISMTVREGDQKLFPHQRFSYGGRSWWIETVTHDWSQSNGSTATVEGRLFQGGGRIVQPMLVAPEPATPRFVPTTEFIVPRANIGNEPVFADRSVSLEIDAPPTQGVGYQYAFLGENDARFLTDDDYIDFESGEDLFKSAPTFQGLLNPFTNTALPTGQVRAAVRSYVQRSSTSPRIYSDPVVVTDTEGTLVVPDDAPGVVWFSGLPSTRFQDGVGSIESQRDTGVLAAWNTDGRVRYVTVWKSDNENEPQGQETPLAERKWTLETDENGLVLDEIVVGGNQGHFTYYKGPEIADKVLLVAVATTRRGDIVNSSWFSGRASVGFFYTPSTEFTDRVWWKALEIGSSIPIFPGLGGVPKGAAQGVRLISAMRNANRIVGGYMNLAFEARDAWRAGRISGEALHEAYEQWEGAIEVVRAAGDVLPVDRIIRSSVGLIPSAQEFSKTLGEFTFSGVRLVTINPVNLAAQSLFRSYVLTNYRPYGLRSYDHTVRVIDSRQVTPPEFEFDLSDRDFLRINWIDIRPAVLEANTKITLRDAGRVVFDMSNYLFQIISLDGSDSDLDTSVRELTTTSISLRKVYSPPPPPRRRVANSIARRVAYVIYLQHKLAGAGTRTIALTPQAVPIVETSVPAETAWGF